MEDGKWNYSIISMMVMVFFSATASYADPATGPLQVHPTNPRYFTDGSGKAIYLAGSHVWNNLQDELAQGVISYSDHLDVLQSYGHNFTRGWHWGDAYYTPLPYARTGPGNANDGGLKFDLTQYNQTYFDRVKARAIEAGNRGMYISIMLFQGWSVDNAYSSGNPGGSRNPNPWPYHPYNKDNNINGIDGGDNDNDDGGAIHRLDIPAVTALQEAYVRKAIDEFNDLDNIIWEISNESRYFSVQWQYHMTNYIKSYEATKPKQHLVWMNARGDWNNADLFNSPADVVSPNGYSGTDYKTNPPATNGNKVILLDTDHIWGVGGDKVWVWKSFTRGYQPIYMDPLYPLTWSRNTWNPDNPQYVGARQAMGYALGYAEQMDLAAMTPQNSLSSTTYCLANPGKEYLIYQPVSNVSFTVNLPAGTYSYEWFNPDTGSVASTGSITAGGGNQLFSAPFSGHSVLYLGTHPIAVIDADPPAGYLPLIVNFDGSGSYDTNAGGSIVAYEWDFDNDGITDSTDSITSHEYLELGTYVVSLKVTDNEGNTGTNTINISAVLPIGDFDGDSDVDQEDFGHLQECMTGNGNPQENPSCLDARLDVDDDVDLGDFVLFQGCMSGAGIPQTDPGCVPD